MSKRFFLLSSILFLILGFALGLVYVHVSDSITASDSHGYIDDRISLTYPDNWEAEEASDELGQHIAGVQLSKYGFTLSLLTRISAASGVVGGRFADISDYTTSQDANDGTNWLDAANCILSSQTVEISDVLSRVDLFLDKTKSVDPVQLEACGNPSGPGVIWYGSYFTESCSAAGASETSLSGSNCNGFYISYEDVSNVELDPSNSEEKYLIFAIRGNKTSASELPQMSDATLQNVLKTASKIVEGVRWE